MSPWRQLRCTLAMSMPDIAPISLSKQASNHSYGPYDIFKASEGCGFNADSQEYITVRGGAPEVKRGLSRTVHGGAVVHVLDSYHNLPSRKQFLVIQVRAVHAG